MTSKKVEQAQALKRLRMDEGEDGIGNDINGKSQLAQTSTKLWAMLGAA